MPSTRSSSRLAGCALSLLLLAIHAPAARAYCRLTTQTPLPQQPCTEQGEPLSWRRPCISYSLTARDSAGPLSFETARDIVDLSFASWSDVRCDGQRVALSLRQTVLLSRCDAPEHSTTAGNSSSIIFVRDWRERELPEDAFGLTVVWHDPVSGEIFDVDMQLNETMGEYRACQDACPPGVVDLQNVVTHEAGHFLGLGHTPVRTAAMHNQARLGETRKRYLGDDDVAGLCAIYGELPEVSCRSENFTPRGGLSLECAKPPETGCTASGGTPGPAIAWLVVGCALLSWRRLKT